MKIKGKLTFKIEHAGELVGIIAQSLAPDNVSEMETFFGKDSASVSFSADKIGTMLSSVDDYLMNARIANDMIENIKNGISVSSQKMEIGKVPPK